MGLHAFMWLILFLKLRNKKEERSEVIVQLITHVPVSTCLFPITSHGHQNTEPNGWSIAKIVKNEDGSFRLHGLGNTTKSSSY